MGNFEIQIWKEKDPFPHWRYLSGPFKSIDFANEKLDEWNNSPHKESFFRIVQVVG